MRQNFELGKLLISRNTVEVHNIIYEPKTCIATGKVFNEPKICVVCKLEDADGLAEGVFEGVHKHFVQKVYDLMSLWCVSREGESLESNYYEYHRDEETAYFILKNLLSERDFVDLCFMTDMVFKYPHNRYPKQIVVASPVLLEENKRRFVEYYKNNYEPKLHILNVINDIPPTYSLYCEGLPNSAFFRNRHYQAQRDGRESYVLSKF